LPSFHRQGLTDQNAECATGKNDCQPPEPAWSVVAASASKKSTALLSKHLTDTLDSSPLMNQSGRGGIEFNGRRPQPEPGRTDQATVVVWVVAR
jgi:hypothetical protein